MKKPAIIIALLLLVTGVLWAAFGGVERVTADRIEGVLVSKGISQPIAACMGGRMAERLSLNQLRKLENLSAREGEADVPLNMAEFLERLRRVDDREAIEVTASSAAICAFGFD